MVRPRPGGTTLLIVVSPVPGKYELYRENNFLAVRIPLASTRVSTHAKKLGDYSLHTWNVPTSVWPPKNSPWPRV